MTLTATTATSEGMNDGNANHPSRQSNRAVKVYVRLMFLRIGEIDTLNEKYQAQASMEARWALRYETLAANLTADDRKQLMDGRSVSLLRYAETHWHPQLYIENAIGDLKEQIRYSAKRSKRDNEFYICEHRDVKGLFWEKLELQHFPSDVQDLSISVASMFYDDKVLLLSDCQRQSGVNREAFVDQQEWSLYQHVNIEQRYVKECFYEDEDEDNDNITNKNDRERSIITVTCHAARHSNYFYWNGYCLIFLITFASFCIFAIPQNLPANRIQISCTLLLTSIAFRWTVNRSLPTISYLTSLDKYAIICIFILIIQCFWHGIIGAVIFLNTPDNRVTPSMDLVRVDQSIFFLVIGLFFIMHIGLLIWLYFVPLRHRKNMKQMDIEYQAALANKKINTDHKKTEENVEKAPAFSSIPLEASF